MAEDDRFRNYGRAVSSGTFRTSKPSRSADTSGGGGGRPHGGGGGQDRSNEIADKINREREEKRKSSLAIQEQINLAADLKSQGVTSDQLTNEQKRQLSDLQFMQDEGVYGGVSGNEAEINKMKKAIVEGGAGYEDALAGLSNLYGDNEELAKVSALGVQEYLRRKTKGDYGAMSDIITGKTQIEGLSRNFFRNLAGGEDPLDPSIHRRTSTIGTGGMGIGTDEFGTYIGGESDIGYDPTGVHTWSDIESDPDLYNKYLNRGTLWDDPLSGLFDPPKTQRYYGEPGGGWGGGGAGAGAGGGGGYYGPQPGHRPEQMAGFYTPQANLQQAMVNVHATPTVFRKRGGIVSLLRLS